MLRSFLALVLAFGFGGAVLAEPLKVVGSDLLVGSMDVELQKFAKSNDHEIAVELKGSRLGLEALQGRQADVGLMVFGADEAKPGAEFSTIVVGYLTAVVAVPQNLALSQVSFEQLAAIYGAREQLDARRWADIGVLGVQAQRSVQVVASSRRAGLALDIFRYNVLSKPELKPTVVLLDDPAAAAARVATEEGGIVLLPTPAAANEKLKVLLVSRASKDVAYGPTPENLHSGDYPLRLPVHLVFRKTDAKKLGFLIRHILADETLPVFTAAGVIALPTQARNQVIFDLETM